MRNTLCASTQDALHTRGARARPLSLPLLARNIGQLAPEPEHGVLKVVAHVGLAHARQLRHAGLVRVRVRAGVGIRVGVGLTVAVTVMVLGLTMRSLKLEARAGRTGGGTGASPWDQSGASAPLVGVGQPSARKVRPRRPGCRAMALPRGVITSHRERGCRAVAPTMQDAAFSMLRRGCV